MIRQLLAAAGLTVSAAASPPSSPPETELPPTGLEFASPSQLRGVPLAELPYAGFELPERVDLSEHMPRPGFQGRQNSCVAWVSAYAVKTYQEKLEQRYTLTRSGEPDLHKIFSPAFVYNQINQGRDGGASLIDALNLLSGRGALSWADMPYDVDNFTRKPNPEQLKSARRYRIAYWRQVNVSDAAELKSHLLAGYPIMVGAMVDESLFRLRPGTIWKRSAGKSLGGHAMVLVGYDERRQAFKVMNSWGLGWADRGFGWIDYRQLAQVVREGYVAKDALNERPIDLVYRDEGDPFRIEPPAPSAGPDTGAGSEPAPASPQARPGTDESGGPDDGTRPGEAERPHKPDPARLSKAGDALNRRSQRGGDLPAVPERAVTRPADADNAEIVFQAEEVIVEPLTLRRHQIAGQELLLSGRALLDDEGQIGQPARVLVRLFYDAAATRPVTAPQPRYALPDGSAVALGPVTPATRVMNWQARIPLAQLPAGVTHLWAKPVLYLDGFGIETGAMLRVRISNK